MATVINLPADITATKIIDGISPDEAEQKNLDTFHAETRRQQAQIIELLTKINNHLRIASGIDDSDTNTF